MLPAVISGGARLLPAVASTAGNFLFKTPVGQTVTGFALYEAGESAWNWMFGEDTDKQKQRDLMSELIDTRQQLEDPNVPNNLKDELAQQDAYLQEQLEAYGINIEAVEETSPEPLMSTMPVPDVPIILDPDQNDQYTTEEFRAIRDMVTDVAAILGTSEARVPELLNMFKTLMQLSESDLDNIIGV